MNTELVMSREELIAAEEVLSEGALRFDGHAFLAHSRKKRTEDYFRALWRELVADDEHRASVEDLMASLFFYHRAGARNNGWFAFRNSDCLTGLRLWLRLHEVATPPRWRNRPHAARWERRKPATRSAAAALVRRWLENGEGTWYC